MVAFELWGFTVHGMKGPFLLHWGKTELSSELITDYIYSPLTVYFKVQYMHNISVLCR